MPKVTIESAQTGLTHNVEFEKNPTPQDIDEIQQQLDAPVLHELENWDRKNPLSKEAFTAQLFNEDKKGLGEKTGDFLKGAGTGLVGMAKQIVVGIPKGLGEMAGEASVSDAPISDTALAAGHTITEGIARGVYGDVNLLRHGVDKIDSLAEASADAVNGRMTLAQRVERLYPHHLNNHAWDSVLEEANAGGAPLVEGPGKINQELANTVAIPASPIGLATAGAGKVLDAGITGALKRIAVKGIAPSAGVVERVAGKTAQILSVPTKVADRVLEETKGTPFERLGKGLNPTIDKALGVFPAGAGVVEKTAQGVRAVAEEVGKEGAINPLFRRVAENTGNAQWIRKSANLLDKVGFTGDLTGKAIKGSATGALAGIPIAAITAENPEQAGQIIGGGAGLGGVMSIGHGILGRQGEINQQNDQIRAEFLKDQLTKAVESGANVDEFSKKMGKLTPETALQVAQLHQALGDKVDISMVDQKGFEATNPGGTGAAFFRELPGGKRQVVVNLDAHGDISSNILHEMGEAFYRSSSTDKTSINSVLASSYTPAEMAQFRNEYAKSYAEGEILKKEGRPREATPDEIQQTANRMDTSHGPDWVQREVFSDSFLKNVMGSDVRKVMRPNDRGIMGSLQDAGLAIKTKFLQSIGVPFDKNGKLAGNPDLIFKNLKATPELRKMVEDVIKERNKYLGSSGDIPEKNAVDIPLQDAGSHPATPLEVNPATGFKENDFVRVDDKGRVFPKSKAEIKAMDKLRVEQIAEKLFNSKPLSVSDPAFGKKVDASGRTFFGGKVLPEWFYKLPSFNESTKRNTKAMESAIDGGETFSGWVQTVGTGPQWGRVVQGLKGNLAASLREFKPLGFRFSAPGEVEALGQKVKKGGNMLVTVLDVDSAQRKALKWSEDGKLDSHWNGDLNNFYSDLKTYLKNHQDNLPGESNGIGNSKKNLLNAFFGVTNKDMASANPLRADPSFKDRSSLIKSFRLDRIQTLEPTGKADWFTDYGKLLANFRPENAPEGAFSPEWLKNASGDIQENLRASTQRRPETGVSKNSQVRFDDEQGRPIFVGSEKTSGGKSFDAWVKENDAWMKQEDVTAARKWYQELHDNFKQNFGKPNDDQNAKMMMIAWLSSQQNVSPSGGLANVFKVEDRLGGIEHGVKGGLADSKIEAILKGLVPEGGYGAKLMDFIDAGFQKKTRTYVGDDPRAGSPFVADVHTGRDAGMVDQQTLSRLQDMADNGKLFVNGLPATARVLKFKTVTVKDQPVKVPESIRFNFGDKGITVNRDMTGSPTKSEYEGVSTWGQNLTKHLNEINYDGGGWTPDQAQAVGWMRILKQYGREGETIGETFSKNTHRISAEVNYSSGNLIKGAYPDISTLPKEAQVGITHDVLTKAVDDLVGIIGGSLRVRDVQTGNGYWVYEGKAEKAPSIQAFVLGSEQATGLLTHALALVSEQAGTIRMNFGKGGADQRSLTLRQANGESFSDDQISSFLKFVAEKDKNPNKPLIGGLSSFPLPDSKGHIIGGINESKAAKIQQLFSEWADVANVDFEIDNSPTVTVTSSHDWKNDKTGSRYRELLNGGGGREKVRAIADYRRKYLSNLEEAFRKHAPEALDPSKEEERIKSALLPEAEDKPSAPPLSSVDLQVKDRPLASFSQSRPLDSVVV